MVSFNVSDYFESSSKTLSLIIECTDVNGFMVIENSLQILFLHIKKISEIPNIFRPNNQFLCITRYSIGKEKF